MIKSLLLATAAFVALSATPVIAKGTAAPAGTDYAARVARVLKDTPLIDGHNDWAETLAEREGEKRWTIDLRRMTPTGPDRYNTDIERLRKGGVGGQFWSVYVSADLPPLEQVKQTLDQIDLVRHIVARYPETFELARTAADVRRIHKAGRIASMMGVEGGGQIANDLSVLRSYQALGAGYLTLTHVLTIDWADAATDNPKHGGLTKFGEAVVHELNRLGMLVDLSHVSEDTMRDALRVSKAPVIFSHSSARALDDHPRDVSDEVLKLVAANGGVVMVNYAPNYVSDAMRRWGADRAAERARLNAPPYGGLFIGQPDKAAAAMKQWEADHPRPVVTLAMVADHVEHIAKVAGVDHVGIGSDYDGVGNELPVGLENVDTYPALLAELMRRGWSDADVAKVAGGNVLRVMERAEAVAASMRGELPATATVAALDKPGK
ncbi:MAG TPA: dipeptidase [Sphingomonas sp.]|nr:dipeptidase [Sphingomonas sp.]